VNLKELMYDYKPIQKSPELPTENEVLIKVYATTCHIEDVKIRGFKISHFGKREF
jgi:hypothetical protein